MKSLVVYRGPSCYDPATIIRAVLVIRSTNSKTGNMAQLHILHDSIAPHTAQALAADFAVCGKCPLRPALGGGCYVVTAQGPNSTYKATATTPVAGAAAIAGALQGRRLRLGAYGDPAALPAHIIAHLSALAGGKVTGYTHGWRARPDLARYCMASVENTKDMSEAWTAGFRTFRARAPGAALSTLEIQCPYERVTCADCLLCRGSQLQAKHISIEVHGSRSRSALRLVS